MTIDQLRFLKESEDKVEFKRAKTQYSYKSGRNSLLGYVTALANENGGYLVFGMEDTYPHDVSGTISWKDAEGKLEQDVYQDLSIRVETQVLFENDKRVLVIKVPSRPIGKPLFFEDIPLMRVGDALVRMSEEKYISIIQEQEPDFSAKICEGLSIEDLNQEAIKKMVESYARKQVNPQFQNLSTEQILSDLKLLENGKLTYAALILLGKAEVISNLLPQSKTIWEYRNADTQIHFDSKEEINGPLFLAIDKVWNLINQPALNKKHPVQSEAYIFDLYDFNGAVIREALLNAMAHRDYTITSEVVVRQYPGKINITNPGGFPKGVNLENILTVSSTPRSRLMTEILEKTGLVERSGQGVDKIFSITLSEGKAMPDYSESDMFQVSLTLYAEIIHMAFHVFLSEYQKSDKEPKLGVQQIITLCKIREGVFQNLKSDVVEQLEKQALIERVSGHTNKYILSDEYEELVSRSQRIGRRYLVAEVESTVLALQNNALRIGELEDILSSIQNRNQIKYLLVKLFEDGIVETEGNAKGTRYKLSTKFADLRGDLLTHGVIKSLKENMEDTGQVKLF